MVSLSVTLNIGTLQNISFMVSEDLWLMIHIRYIYCNVKYKSRLSYLEQKLLKSNSDRIIEGQRQTVAEFGQITSERSGSSQEKDIIHSSIIQDYHN